MKKVHWMVSLVRVITILFVLLGCFVLFLYSPFYSQVMVKGLNHFVSFNVNETAAESQKSAALSEHESLEPGSNLWIARQAYLQLLEEGEKEPDSEELRILQVRYQLLQKLIVEEQDKEPEQVNQKPIIAAEALEHVQEDESAASSPLSFLEHRISDNRALIDAYVDFLNTYPVPLPVNKEQESSLSKDLHESKKNKQEMIDSKDTNQPYAIVVLGGGLTLGENGKDIVVNNYTRLRLERTLEVEKQYDLPIVLSGVEAPYMQAWLEERGIKAKLLENRSMNTCENSRFSSLLLQKKGGAPKVILITDEYHMPRTRRLFALNGIETVPVVAPMPTKLTSWRPSEKNYDHSRRANYELLATIRDVLFGSSDCREIP
ncbi:YdcF family protein [Acinetobacter suaedae]|uniref:YdcF family protein n=1 Tax=Acinetobacter suaedae TaxID=2609668 RepID=A0A5P1UTX3_9GAMM|nr:YdcF family protein [Acinetobacter sp. C16S1]QER39788.1 YdcF family protein [Acinetobacter sp. C16S1]